MSIDVSKLENCRQKDGKTIARCPACAEMGQDKHGNHLVINEDGRFGCVVYQGDHGRDHRKRIFHLVGEKSRKNTDITLQKTSHLSQNQKTVLIKDVLGQMGQHLQTSLEKMGLSDQQKIEELVRLYADISVGRDVKDREVQERRFSHLWGEIDGRDHNSVTEALCDKGLLPMVIKQAIGVFDGTVVKLL
jgi:hypothetical protein